MLFSTGGREPKSLVAFNKVQKLHTWTSVLESKKPEGSARAAPGRAHSEQARGAGAASEIVTM